MTTRLAVPALTLCLLLAQTGQAQTITESRDAARGVTFLSLQLSSDEVGDVQTMGALFSSSDTISLGISGLIFDEASGAGDFVLWLSHDGGRRWFGGSATQPLTIRLDDERLIQPATHSWPAAATPSRNGTKLRERVEFSIPPSDFEHILAADQVSVVITTVLGTLEKQLTKQELEQLRRFEARVASQGS